MVSEEQWSMKMVRHTFMSHGDFEALVTAAGLSSQTHPHVSKKLFFSNVNTVKLRLYFYLNIQEKLPGHDGACSHQ